MRAYVAIVVLAGSLGVVGCSTNVNMGGTIKPADTLFALDAGGACSKGADCGSGFCLGGACCALTSCGSDATCQGTRCDETGACVYPQGSCGTTSCEGATLTTSACELGACVANAPAACPNKLTCVSGTACRSSCATASDCISGFSCVNGACEDCIIDGGEVLSGTVDPGACRSCLPDRSLTSWTNLDDGTVCGAASCDATTNLLTTNACAGGTCTAETPTVCPGNLVCADSTQCRASCASSADCTTGFSCVAGSCQGCTINGGFVPSGSIAAGGCLACLPDQSLTNWSALSDGTACGPSDICVAGTCQLGCFIDGGVFAIGDLNSANDCQACTLPSTTQWGSQLVGSPCGDGGACDSNGTCGPNIGCAVGAVQVVNGASNPADPSLCCNSGQNAYAWSKRLVLGTTASVASQSEQMVTGDFDGDGWLDLAVVTHPVPSSVSVFLNDRGVLQSGVSYSVGDEARALVAVDLNGDGFLDLVSENATGQTLSVLMGNGDGTFNAAIDYPTNSGSGAGTLKSGDFNGDGIPDLVVGSASSLQLLFGIGDGGLLPYVSVPGDLGGSSGELAVGDFNGDGTLDVAEATAWRETVTVFEGLGDGGFVDGGSYSVPNGGGGFFYFAAGDLDGDGTEDLAGAAMNEMPDSATLRYLFGAGKGLFGEWNAQPSYGPIASLVVADLDGDGNNELLFSAGVDGGADAGEQSALFQVGVADGGSSNRIFDMAPDHYAWGTVVGDFNQDGAQDVAIVDLHGEPWTVEIYFNGCPR